MSSGSSTTFVYTLADGFSTRSWSNELLSKDKEDDVVAVVLDQVCWFVHLDWPLAGYIQTKLCAFMLYIGKPVTAVLRQCLVTVAFKISYLRQTIII